MTAVLFAVALSLLLFSLGHQIAGNISKPIQMADRVAFAIIVAIIVRWVGIFFAETESIEESDHIEYYEAIKNANSRIWICQTWLPGGEGDAHRIIDSKAADIRLMLASFKEGSPILARIAGRKIEPRAAKVNVAGSVWPFVKQNKKNCLRFNSGHHPGWIAVIDSRVFWGPTPVDKDNQAIDFLFHVHNTKGQKGTFWENQFNVLWSACHGYDTEKRYNEQLARLEASVRPDEERE